MLVVGAGPAGSAAARVLARAGLDVRLVDRHEFPRDKVCGDALIPDALAALRDLGLKERVVRRARVMDRIRVFAPNGRHVDVTGSVACVPRRVLDEELRQGALEVGARFTPPLRLEGALRRDGGVEGARFVDPRTGGSVEIRSRLTLLATGAAVGPLQAFGVCERDRASAMAARIYYELPPAEDARVDVPCISYDRAICPGYGWVFPGPERICNVGVGFFHDGRRPPPVANLRHLFERFVATFPLAREIVRAGRPLGSLKGAPLRTGLTGATLFQPGLLVVGEAAGLTYSFSGEGIGKAMASGMIAAELAVAAMADGRTGARIGADYASRLRAEFEPRFRAYRLAQDWLSRPAFANFLAWRAGRGSFVRAQLEALLNETGDPRTLFSPAGVVRALFT